MAAKVLGAVMPQGRVVQLARGASASVIGEGHNTRLYPRISAMFDELQDMAAGDLA